MSVPEDQLSENAAEAAPTPRQRRWPYLLTIGLGLLALGLLGLWLERENLAHRIIGRQLDQYDLPATYHLEQVGPLTQVVSHVVVGDPKRPDFTAERVEIRIEPTFGLPTIGQVRLVRPRLYGSYRGGRLSFGSLDKVLLAPGARRATGLPDLDLRLEDGRARIDTELGAVGIKADGRGNLRQAFAGQIAAIAPSLQIGQCRIVGASAFGRLTSDAGRPAFAGPLRLGQASCPDLNLGSLALQAEVKAPADLASVTATGKVAGGPLNWAGHGAVRVDGSLALSIGAQSLAANYDLTARDLSGQLAARSLSITGSARSRAGLARLEGEGQVTGAGLRPGTGLEQTLLGIEQAARGTPGGPLLAQLRASLRREGAGSRLSADFALRRNEGLVSLVVPRLELRGTSGQDLLVISRGQLGLGGPAAPRISGNLRTGGPGLPRLSGQIERGPGGVLQARLAMTEYRAANAMLALPELVIIRRRDGATGLVGRAMLSGPLPSGAVERLVVPLEGTWTSAAGLALWRRCTPLQFSRLRYASVALDARTVTLCPEAGRAILVAGPRGTRFAAGAPQLSLAGRLGQSPIRVNAGAIGFAWPGGLVARQVDIAVGPAGATSRFTIATLGGRLGLDVAGRFSGAEARLAAVPLDISDASGTWRYAGGRLSLGEGAFRLEDRLVDDRFRPVVARGASLGIESNRITATAALREPDSDRVVAETRIIHDLNSGTGHADLTVPGLLFDERLQPDRLSQLALGVIANARGVVRGAGRIDWNAAKVTSSGSFSSENFDFAAAFGPVRGVSGTVHFTDLLGMVTAPDQMLAIAAINPGIEVYEGKLRFQLEPDRMLVVKGAEWPFIGGRLQLLPTKMRLGASNERRFTLRLTAADAAKFVQQIDMSNLAATGVFDGDLPLVFDEQGGRIEGGLLISRPPGGNVSYVGALTYKDMGAMANFAFQALRSLDYQQMRIGMDGDLAGEIVTRVRIDGVTQGAGAKRNFLTRRLARLPIRFNINVRAPFQGLLHSFRSLYDPAYLRDPRELGLIDQDGKPIAQPAAPPSVIQPSDSRKVP